MKNFILTIMCLVITIQFQAQGNQHKYALKSGKLVMKLTGNTTGTKTIYFDDYGDKYYEEEKSVTVTKMFGITDKTENDKVFISNKDKYWSVDNINGSNMSGTLQYYDLGKEIAKSMTEEEQEQLADDVLNSFGGKKLGQEKVLGYTCDVIEVMGAKSWIYKGVILRSEAKVMGIETNEIATEFEKNISIPSSRFTKPSGTTFEDVDDLQKQYYGEMGMISDEEEDDYDDDDIVALKYLFSDFQEAVNDFTPDGYTQSMVMNQDGQYLAVYNKGFTNMITIIASSEDNIEEDDGDVEGFETFTHNGKEMRYGNLAEEGMPGTALIVPYEEHDMYILIMAAPSKDKETLVKYSDNLDF